MKKLIPILFSAVFIASYCAKKPVIVKRKPKPKPKTYELDYEGWVNKDGFQVVAKGEPYESASGLMRRRKQAKEDAQYRAKERTITLMAKEIGGEQYEDKVREKFDDAIENGKILDETCDFEETCQITYRIKAKSLKKNALKLGKKSSSKKRSKKKSKK